MYKILTGVAALAVALSVGGLWLSGGDRGETDNRFVKALGLLEPEKPITAPSFTLPDLRGKPVSLQEFQGKVVFLNFWATWCIPCQWEMPEMDKLYQAYKDQGFVVLAVSLDQGPKADVEDFVKKRKLTYPVMVDSRAEVAGLYGLRGVPGTYLIGTDGNIRYAVFGPREWFGKEARSLIELLLASAKSSKGR